jgi:uncharacterized protein YifE (UPF0438 family)
MSSHQTRLSLSVKGLQRLEGGHIEKEFAFVIDGNRYCCPCLLAEFLSPRVAALRSQDVTVREFSLETKDPNGYFGTVLSLAYGREVSVNDEEKRFVRSVRAELKASELFEATLDGGEIKGDEMKARVEFLSRTDGDCEFDVSVVASHFYEFSVSDFHSLSVSAAVYNLACPNPARLAMLPGAITRTLLLFRH